MEKILIILFIAIYIVNIFLDTKLTRTKEKSNFIQQKQVDELEKQNSLLLDQIELLTKQYATLIEQRNLIINEINRAKKEREGE